MNEATNEHMPTMVRETKPGVKADVHPARSPANDGLEKGG